ncbi:double-stranded RNA-binding protein 1-like [Vigna unguiculata]|uniref:double-stranded RNA-binding protein 1-like n=1 Tax=Vigna unguiculata TaxID=3917 RepID=UPI00101601EE|nr:double-stranded RNA-binding protein 1-like [Vigna unguiculata]
MYKTKLQELCHKRKWGLPSYSAMKDGPDHIPSFKASVHVHGVIFTSSSASSSLKEAKNQAAMVAFLSLSSGSSTQISDSGTQEQIRAVKPKDSSIPAQSSVIRNVKMYKTKLQELCHKRKWGLPRYSGMKSGPDHIPSFKANVHVNGVIFTSSSASSSIKEAENKAAMVALLSFCSGSPRQTSKDDTKEQIRAVKPQQSSTPAQFSVIIDEQCSSVNNLHPPVFACKTEDLPPANDYKATVLVDGHSTESPSFTNTIKETERASDSILLSPDIFQMGDSDSFKTSLMKLTEREGFHKPTYKTMQAGSPYRPTFFSTLEVEGEEFHGKGCRFKKEAEEDAAKIAYIALKKLMCDQHDFAKNIVQRKRSPRSLHRTNGNDADAPPGFPPKPGGTVYTEKSSDYASNARKGNSDANVPSDFLVKRLKTVPSGIYAQDGFKDNEDIDAEVPARCKNLFNQTSSACTVDYENAKRMSPQEKLVGKDTVEPLILKEEVEDANGSKEATLSIEGVTLSGAQGESYNCVSGMNVIDQHDFAKNIVQRKRSPRSLHRTNGNDADVPPGFPPKLGGTVYTEKSSDDALNARKGNSDANVPSEFLVKRLKTVPSGNYAQDGFKDQENINAEVPARCKYLSNQSSSASTIDYKNAKRMSPQAKLVGKDSVEPLILKEEVEDANWSIEARLSTEGVSLSGAQGESYNCVSGMNVIDLEQRIKKLETVIEKLKITKLGHC